MSRHASQEQIDRVIAVLRRDPELTAAQLRARFGVDDRRIALARAAAGVGRPGRKT